MEPEYRDNEFPMVREGLVATRLECLGGSSLFHEVCIIRDIDRYLRLGDLRVVLFADMEGRCRPIDASDHLNWRKSLIDGLDFVESHMNDIVMYEMHGTWHDYVSVLIVWMRGHPFLSVFVPFEAPATARRQIVADVKRGIALGS